MKTQDVGETLWQMFLSHSQPVASWIVNHPVVPIAIATIVAFIVIFGRKW